MNERDQMAPAMRHAGSAGHLPVVGKRGPVNLPHLHYSGLGARDHHPVLVSLSVLTSTD